MANRPRRLDAAVSLVSASNKTVDVNLKGAKRVVARRREQTLATAERRVFYCFLIYLKIERYSSAGAIIEDFIGGLGRFRSFFSFDGATSKILLDFWRRAVYNGIYLDLGIVRLFGGAARFSFFIMRPGSFERARTSVLSLFID